MEKTISGVVIECVSGDITAQEDITAVVNAANAQLRTGGGVAGALHLAAGPELEKECRSLAPIKPGQAVITSGQKLPNQYIVHCLGPVFGRDKPEEKLLANCYRNALHVAEEFGIDSIAFPAISTGAFGYPVAEAANIALKTIKEMLPQLKHVKRIRFVLFDRKSLDMHKHYMEETFRD